jgi:hypothetical protein
MVLTKREKRQQSKRQKRELRRHNRQRNRNERHGIVVFDDRFMLPAL